MSELASIQGAQVTHCELSDVWEMVFSSDQEPLVVKDKLNLEKGCDY